MIARTTRMWVFALAMSVVALPLLQAQTPRAIPKDDEQDKTDAPRREALPDDRDDENRPPPPPPAPILLLTADMNCRVEIDGRRCGSIPTDHDRPSCQAPTLF